MLVLGSILDRFGLHFEVKNRSKINVKSTLDFGSIFGGPWGVPGNFHGISWIQLEDPGWLGEGRVRVKPSPKGCGIFLWI